MSVPKNQHYVPRFYLKGFADHEGRVFAVRKVKDGCYQDKPFNPNVKNICSGTYYNEVRAVGPGCSNAYIEFGVIERRLGDVENKLGKGFAKLRADVSDLSALTERSLRESVPYAKILLASLIVRNPTTLDHARSSAPEFTKMLVSEGVITADDCKLIVASGMTVESLVEHSILKTELLGTVEGSSMHELLRWLNGMDPIILRAPVLSEFVTADVPFALLWESGDTTNPDYAFFPIDKKTAILFHNLGGAAACHQCTPSTVSMWNQFIMSWSSSTGMVIAHRRETLMREMTVHKRRVDQALKNLREEGCGCG